MRYKKTKNNNFASFLSSIAIIMLVVLVLGFLFFRTDGLTTGLKRFYVKYGEESFIADRENFNIIINKEYRFDIVNEMTGLTGETDYLVKIVPNDVGSVAFDFSVDNQTKHYIDVDSLSSGFIISCSDNYFTIKAIEDLTTIMQDIYKTNNVVGCPTAVDSGLPYFRLVISNVGSNDTININFNIKSE